MIYYTQVYLNSFIADKETNILPYFHGRISRRQINSGSKSRNIEWAWNLQEAMDQTHQEPLTAVHASWLHAYPSRPAVKTDRSVIIIFFPKKKKIKETEILYKFH